MAVSFDTWKLARRFEAAGIEAKQAGDMAEAMCEANLVTPTDLALAVRDLTIWTGSIADAAIVIIFGALHLWPPHYAP
ncbi:MAG TPA: DUF1640 domain-containing protein [Hyphomicrobiaceae bacterium]|nr:DUF1640 domain-containing protein [Hyphomicrobiaceae bacterium]